MSETCRWTSLGVASGTATPRSALSTQWDADAPAYMAQALFPKLTNSPYKRYVELGDRG